MKIAIVGSRTWKDVDVIEKFIDSLPDDTEIVSGGARGVDTIAEQYAKKRGLSCKVFLPDWETHGRSAGILRNGQIVMYADEVVAFWDGKSKGTYNTIDRALNMSHIEKVVVIKSDDA